MPCSICRQAGHNRQRCPILRDATRLQSRYEFVLVREQYHHNVTGAAWCARGVEWKGFRVDDLFCAPICGGRRTECFRRPGSQLTLDRGPRGWRFNRGVVDFWERLRVTWVPPEDAQVFSDTRRPAVDDLIYCRANIRLLNAFATKLQRWFRSLEELPMACPCPE